MISWYERTSSLRPQIAGVALALTIGLSGAVATAQDATPSSSPDVTCAMVMEDASPEASPAAASPVAETPTGDVVTDEAVIADLTAAVATCNPDLGEDVEVIEVVQFDTNHFGIEYQYMQGRQVLRVLEMYSVENSTWTQGDKQSKSAATDEDTITISAKIGGDPAIEVSPGTFNITPAMRVSILNRDAADLSLALFSASEEVDTDALTGTDAASLPASLELQGETMVMAGESGDMLIEGIEEGTYVLVVLDSNDSVVAASPLTVDPPLDLGL